MPPTQSDDEHDQANRDTEIRENLANHDFTATERCHQQLIKRAGLSFPRNRARHQRDGEQLQNESDDSRNDIIDEAFLGIIKKLAVRGPRSHERDKLMTDIKGQSFSKLENFLGQGIDDHVPLLHLKIAQTLTNASLQLVRGIGVGRVEVQRQGFWISILQTFAPTCWNN